MLVGHLQPLEFFHQVAIITVTVIIAVTVKQFSLGATYWQNYIWIAWTTFL